MRTVNIRSKFRCALACLYLLSAQFQIIIHINWSHVKIFLLVDAPCSLCFASHYFYTLKTVISNHLVMHFKKWWMATWPVMLQRGIFGRTACLQQSFSAGTVKTWWWENVNVTVTVRSEFRSDVYWHVVCIYYLRKLYLHNFLQCDQFYFYIIIVIIYWCFCACKLFICNRFLTW